jgi:hypothetical protein
MARSGLYCPNCALPGQRSISQDALQVARRMSNEKLEQLVKAEITPAAMDELKDHMLNLIEQHIEKKLQTRKMLADEPEQLK